MGVSWAKIPVMDYRAPHESVMLTAAPIIVGLVGTVIYMFLLVAVVALAGNVAPFLVQTMLAAVPMLLSVAGISAAYPSKAVSTALAAAGCHAIGSFAISYYIAAGVHGAAATHYRFFIPELYAPTIALPIAAIAGAWFGIQILSRG